MYVRRGKVICRGTIETAVRLEQFVQQGGARKVPTDSGPSQGSGCERRAFCRVYEMNINGHVFNVRFFYDHRDGTAEFKASPSDMTRLRQQYQAFKSLLWQMAKSGENLTKKKDRAMVNNPAFRTLRKPDLA